MYICIYRYIYIYVCIIYMCIYIYISMKRKRENREAGQVCMLCQVVCRFETVRRLAVFSLGMAAGYPQPFFGLGFGRIIQRICLDSLEWTPAHASPRPKNLTCILQATRTCQASSHPKTKSLTLSCRPMCMLHHKLRSGCC